MYAPIGVPLTERSDLQAPPEPPISKIRSHLTQLQIANIRNIFAFLEMPLAWQEYLIAVVKKLEAELMPRNVGGADQLFLIRFQEVLLHTKLEYKFPIDCTAEKKYFTFLSRGHGIAGLILQVILHNASMGLLDLLKYCAEECDILIEG